MKLGGGGVALASSLSIYNDGEAMIYIYHYAHFCHTDSGSQWANELFSLIIVLFSF